ncbi:MAG: hypothetical protein WBE99_16295, partial [Xanthobacteraceae bacterium]
MAEHADKPLASGALGLGSRLVPGVSAFSCAAQHEVFERGQSARLRVGVAAEIIYAAKIRIRIEPFTGTVGKIVEKRNMAALSRLGPFRKIPFSVEERIGIAQTPQRDVVPSRIHASS